MDSRLRRRRGGPPRRRLPAWCSLLAAAVVSALIWPVYIGWWVTDVPPPSGWPVLLLIAALATLVVAAVLAGRAARPTPALAAAGLPLAAVGGRSVWTSDPLGPIGAVILATLVLVFTVIPVTFARPDPPPLATTPPSR